MTTYAMKIISIVTLALVQGCLASAKRVRLPDGSPATRVECNYDAANCELKARQVCHGDYQIVHRGNRSCENCGFDINGRWADGNNVYKGVLHVRCAP